jgi:peptidoglycan hydrolase CwlO-like protein
MGPETWAALLAAIFGGAGVKLFEKWLGRSQTKDDSATKLRTELREELTRLRAELEKTEKDLDETRAKYYKMLEEFTQAKIDLQNALNEIKRHDEDE